MTLGFDRKAISEEKNQTRLFDMLKSNGDEKPENLKVKKVDVGFHL